MPAPNGFSAVVPSGGFKQWFRDLWDVVDGLTARTQRLEEAAQPSGVMQMWAGTATPADGWLICDGAAISRSDYAALYSVIGTTYGTGNGSTTFNLPNLVNRFPRGAAAPGGTGGAATHVHGLTTAVADFRSSGVAATFQVRTRTSPSTRDLNRQLTSAASQTDTTTSSSAGIALTGETDSASSLPPYLDVRFIIKS